MKEREDIAKSSVLGVVNEWAGYKKGLLGTVPDRQATIFVAKISPPHPGFDTRRHHVEPSLCGVERAAQEHPGNPIWTHGAR